MHQLTMVMFCEWEFQTEIYVLFNKRAGVCARGFKPNNIMFA
jgi:hypothetical protein